MDDSERAQFAAELGASVNKNGGIYARGVSYGYAKKLEVAAEIKFVEALASREGKDPSLNAIAKRCRVGWHFVKKIQDELYFYGRVRRPSEILENKDILRGAGARTLDSLDRFVLLQLLREQPGRSLTSYHKLLFDYTGTVASKKTISRFFREAFPHRGGFVKPNLVPYDKFRPENKTRAYEFLYMLSHFAPERVKFGDEKSLKGQELYSKKVRRDPETGDVPVVATPSDFRNTYSITGFCSIDQRTNPIFYRIQKDNNNSLEFRNDIEDALREGFLVAGDVLVLDNVAYHPRRGACRPRVAAREELRRHPNDNRWNLPRSGRVVLVRKKNERSRHGSEQASWGLPWSIGAEHAGHDPDDCSDQDNSAETGRKATNIHSLEPPWFSPSNGTAGGAMRSPPGRRGDEHRPK